MANVTVRQTLAWILGIALPLGAQTAFLNYRAAHNQFYLPDWFVGATLVIGFALIVWTTRRRLLIACVYFPLTLYLSVLWSSWFLQRVFGVS